MKKCAYILRLIKVYLILFPILVSACFEMQKKIMLLLPIALLFVAASCVAQGPANPTLSNDDDNTGLLANITCNGDNFAFSLEKQKTGLFQIYRNGEYTSDRKISGKCNVGELDIVYNISYSETAVRKCIMHGDAEYCSLYSPSFIKFYKNSMQLADVHIYPEERMFSPSKIIQIEANGDKFTFCRTLKHNRLECKDSAIDQLLSRPFLFQRGTVGMY